MQIYGKNVIYIVNGVMFFTSANQLAHKRAPKKIYVIISLLTIKTKIPLRENKKSLFYVMFAQS